MWVVGKGSSFRTRRDVPMFLLLFVIAPAPALLPLPGAHAPHRPAVTTLRAAPQTGGPPVGGRGRGHALDQQPVDGLVDAPGIRGIDHGRGRIPRSSQIDTYT